MLTGSGFVPCDFCTDVLQNRAGHPNFASLYQELPNTPQYLNMYCGSQVVGNLTPSYVKWSFCLPHESHNTCSDIVGVLGSSW